MEMKRAADEQKFSEAAQKQTMAELLQGECKELQQELKILVEPTSALAMAACEGWLAEQAEARRVLVILSGSNLDPARMRSLWA